MTSVPPKVNPPHIDRFESGKLTCYIMPACVATSFPHISNDVYKQDYLGNEQDPVSETSSPESQRFDSFNKRHQYCQSNISPDNFHHVTTSRCKQSSVHPHPTKKDIDSKPTKSCRRIFKELPSTRQEERPNDERSSISPNEDLIDVSSEASTPKKINVVSSTPKRGYPRKQKMVLSRDGISSETFSHISLRKKCIQTPSAFKLQQPSKLLQNQFDRNSSSDILRRMYVTFGSSSNDTESDRSVKPLTAHFKHCDVSDDIPKVNKRKRGIGSADISYEGSSESGGKGCSASTRWEGNVQGHRRYNSNCGNFKSNCHCVHKGCKSSSCISVLFDRSLSDPVKEPACGFKLDNDSVNISKMEKSDKLAQKQKLNGNNFNDIDSPERKQRDSSSKRPFGEYSSSDGRKRARYSSSESSTDSVQKLPHNPLHKFYNPNGHDLSYINPLLYSPAVLSTLGLSTTGYHLPIPSFPQASVLDRSSNPLMFGTNPYLTNPLLLCEMLNQASAANMVSMLPNPALHHLSFTSGASVEQLRAIHQMQAARMYKQDGAFFNPSLFTPSLPTMTNTLSPAKTKHGDTYHRDNIKRKNNAKKLHLSDRTLSDEAMKEMLSSVSFTPYQMNKSSRSSEIQMHKLASPDNHHVGPRISSNRRKSGFKLRNETYRQGDVSNLHSRIVKENGLSNTHLSSNEEVCSKKRQDKTFEKKDKHNPKLLPEMMHPTKYSKMEDVKKLEMEEDTFDNSVDDGEISSSEKPQGYKNLTRERRLVANARERTRVHTISSAFEELRAQIPSYSCNQKLSKLAILRIACEYIRTLSVLAGHDETTTLPQGVDQCTRVLQSESRARSRRKSNKAQIEWEMANYEHHKSREEHNCDIPQHHKPPFKISKEKDITRRKVSSSRNNFAADLSISPVSSVADGTDIVNDVFDNDVEDGNDNDVIDVEVIDEQNIAYNDTNSNTLLELEQINCALHSSQEDDRSQEENSSNVSVE